MLKFRKALVFVVTAIFIMSCNLLNLGQKIAILKLSSTDEPGATSAAKAPAGSGQDSTVKFACINIPTQVHLVDGILAIPYIFSYFESESEYYATYIVLEDTSSDPMDMITEFDYTMTWYDENHQVLDEWVNTYNNRMLPQEKVLFKLWPDEDKVGDKKIASAEFNVTSVTSFKSFADSELMTQLQQTTVKHPIISVSASDFTFDYVTLLFDPVPQLSTKVETKSNLTTPVGVKVIGIYLNEQGSVVGVGKSDSFQLDPGGSGIGEIVAYDMTEKPSQAVYFAEIVSPGDVMEVAYPELFK